MAPYRPLMRLPELITAAIDLFYIKPVAKLVPRQTFRYAACGGVNVVLSWVIYFLIYNFVLDKQIVDLGFVAISPHIATMLITVPLILLSGFWLNRNIAFRRSPVPAGVQLFRYTLTFAGSVVLNYICLKIFVDAWGFWATPAQMLWTFIGLIYSYLAAKYFTFRNSASE